MNKRKSLYLYKSLFYSAGLAFSNIFYITEVMAETTTIEEIVVSAQKRGATTVQDTPISMQAFSGDDLQDLGVQEFLDIAPMISSLQFQDFGPGDREYIIRGVNSKGPSTVGVYYDEVVITARNSETGGGRNFDIRLYDLSHVEILKGPQGTLYGASSMSGTIRYITNKPTTEEIEGYISTEFSDTRKGDFNYSLNGMLNLPVTDSFAVRLVGWYVDNDGFIDAPRALGGVSENINTEKTKGARFAARWIPNDRLTIDASYTHQELDTDGPSRYTPSSATPFDATSIDPSLAADQGCDLCNFDLTYNPWKEDAQISSIKLEYNSDYGTYTAASSFYHRDISFNYDNTAILLSFGVPTVNLAEFINDQDIWSTEVRFASSFNGPAQVVIGVYYNVDDLDFDVDVVAANSKGRRANNCELFHPERDVFTGGGNNVFCRTFDTKSEQYAVFGELTYQLTDKLSATAGLRYFDSELEALQRTTHPFFGNTAGSGDFLSPTVQTSEDNKTTWKLGLSYDFSEETMGYLTVSEGFRIGGVNRSPAIPGVPFFSDYEPDVIRNYEIGLKTKLKDGRLQLSTALFWLDWKDIQQVFTDPQFGFEFITNQGDSTIQGMEVEVTAQLTDRLRLQAGGSYQYARLTSDGFLPDGGDSRVQPLDGDEIPNVPRFQGSAALIYSKPLTEDIEAIYRMDVSYRGEVENVFNSNDPGLLELDGYSLVNLRAIFTYRNWSFTAFVRNLEDKRAQVDGVNYNLFPTQITTVRPRTIGASVNFRF